MDIISKIARAISENIDESYEGLPDEDEFGGDLCCICEMVFPDGQTGRCDACRDNRMCEDCAQYDPSGQLLCCPRCYDQFGFEEDDEDGYSF